MSRVEVAAWQADCDRLEPDIDWPFTTESARIKLKRLDSTFVV